MSSKNSPVLTLVASQAAIGNLARRHQVTMKPRPFLRDSGPTWVNSPRMSNVAPSTTSVRAAFDASADRKAA